MRISIITNIILLFLLVVVVADNDDIFKKYNGLVDKYTALTYDNNKLESLRKYQPLDDAMARIAKHPYTDDYQCLDFSSDLVNELKKEGIQSEIVVGRQPGEEKYHAWVGVWFSPQLGEFSKNFYTTSSSESVRYKYNVYLMEK